MQFSHNWCKVNIIFAIINIIDNDILFPWILFSKNLCRWCKRHLEHYIGGHDEHTQTRARFYKYPSATIKTGQRAGKTRNKRRTAKRFLDRHNGGVYGDALLSAACGLWTHCCVAGDVRAVCGRLSGVRLARQRRRIGWGQASAERWESLFLTKIRWLLTLDFTHCFCGGAQDEDLVAHPGKVILLSRLRKKGLPFFRI